MWDDEEFLALTSTAQRVYMLLFSQKAIKLTGVLDYTPRRWARLSKTSSLEEVSEALGELCDTRFVIIDHETDELLVRTFLRHDGTHPDSRVWTAALNQIDAIVSASIKAAVMSEVERIVRENGDPDRVFAQTPPGGMEVRRFVESEKTVGPDRFEEFYAVFPLHIAKQAAQKAWPKALTKADAETIVAGARRYREDPNRDPGFTKHPATWLNGGCWKDDPLPPRVSRPANANRETINRVLDRLMPEPNHFDVPELNR